MERQSTGQDDGARAEQWAADRAQEAAPLPYADRQKYQQPFEKAVDLGAAEKSNIARAAGELGLTTTEWQAKYKELGRNPRHSDL